MASLHVVTKCESAAGSVGITYTSSVSMHSDNIDVSDGQPKGQ
jgi:hypothetical protein